MARYITDLDSASSLQDADIVLASQSGVDKQTTIGAIKTAVDSYTESEADTKFLKGDFTVLADFPARKYNGTITLSEDITNFEYLIVKVQHYAGLYIAFAYFPTALIDVGNKLDVWKTDVGYANWTYTNTTTLTSINENLSWVRTVYGMGRK